MRPLAATVARIAARQRGRITVEQLAAIGVDRGKVKRWMADGRLRREHQGVYAVGHPDPSPQGVYLSAVLAAGPGASVSHAAAAHLLGLLRGRVPRAEVTIPSSAHRQRPGIVIHRVRALHPLDASSFERIPIMIVPRVLLDLAPRLPPAQLSRACHEAWVRHRTTPEHVEACIARNPRKPGIAALRRALGTDVTLSVLEDGFLALLDEHGLPRPRTNVDCAGDKVDCHWPQLDLTVELLSYRYHGTRRAFEADVARRRRSSHLAYTYGDVCERAAATAAELTARLAAAAADRDRRRVP